MAVELYTHPLYSDANCISYYRLEGNSNDTKGNVNGTDANITYSADNGKFGQGAGFNGSSSCIYTSAQILATNATAYTILTWIKSASYAADGVIACDRTAASYIYNYFFRVSGGKLVNTVHDGSTLVNTITGATTVSTNVWHLASLTWNGTLQKLFLDGAEDASGANTYFSNHTAYPSFGRRQGPVTDSYYSGQMDDIVYFNRALTPTEILNFYNATAFVPKVIII